MAKHNPTMIPTDRFAALLLVSGLMIGFSGWLAVLMPTGIALAAVALALAIADWRSLASVTAPEISRTVDEKLSLGAANPVIIHIRNSSSVRLQGMIRDEYPEDFSAKGNVMPLDLRPRAQTSLTYHTTPPHRGDFRFGDVFVRIRGHLGMMTRQIMLPMCKPVKVYPNILDMRRYDIGLKRQSIAQPGQRVAQMHGRGTDFESLRDYMPDDEFRSIDWKASARRSKFVSRQYQEEKSQNVLLVIDCGRVMGPVIHGLSRLDWSVNAAMMLAHVASSKGDRVGLMPFGQEILGYVPPRAGKSQVLSLLSMTYNLSSAAGDSDYFHSFPFLTRKWTRRSLVVVFTELTDPEASKPLISQLLGLTKKHLCMCVAMADPAVIEAAHSTPTRPEDAFRAAAAKQVLHDRKLAAAQLARAGAIVVDVLPEHFTPSVVNQYLRIKGAGRL